MPFVLLMMMCGAVKTLRLGLVGGAGRERKLTLVVLVTATEKRDVVLTDNYGLAHPYVMLFLWR